MTHVRRPRLASVLQYYSPYVSGLSDVARRLNEGLVERGWDVHVVTTRYDRSLAPHSNVDGVSVRRCTSVGSVGRAAVSPTFPLSAIRAARNADVVMLHLPLPEAAAVAVGAFGRPLVSLYHCDAARLLVPMERSVRSALDRSNSIAIRRAAVRMATSRDYAEHSRLADVLTPGLQILPPPCRPPATGTAAFRETSGRHVGFLGRIVPEKSLEFLIEAFRRLEDEDARLLIAGDFDRVAGGAAISTVATAASGDPRIRILGFLDDEALANFYASIDVFALPSVSSFEAFGIVQVEALMAGVPVIASGLAGVRAIVENTSGGVVVAPRDVDALAGPSLR